MLWAVPGFLPFLTNLLYTQSRSHTFHSARVPTSAHVCPTVPAIKKHFEALGSLDGEDIDIPHTVPQRATSFKIVAIEADAGKDTCALTSARSTLLSLTSDKLQTA